MSGYSRRLRQRKRAYYRNTLYAAGFDGSLRPRVPREVARAEVGCPFCGAAAGEPCKGKRGPRVSNHLERVLALGEKRIAEIRSGSQSRGSGD